jgi:transmembrane sensor
MKKAPFNKLLEKYRAGTASPEELEFLAAYYNAFELRPDYTDDSPQELWLDMKAKIDQQIDQHPSPKIIPMPGTRVWAKLAVAASVLLLIGIGALVMTRKHTGKPLAKNSEPDIHPGGNRATLTLANGQTILLSNSKSGIIIQANDLTYNDGTKVAGATGTTAATAYNTISTPSGGQYQVHLPDGTNVWLNAASSLKYPGSFATLKERRVELTGEAYFEVAPNSALPFRVETPRQKIEVLGTSFNVSAYEDEPVAKTTLLNGSVKVSIPNTAFSNQLKPGEEVSRINDRLVVETVNTADAIAWKNGLFIFNDEPLESIMRKVARWYDVEVVYVGVNRQEPYGGSFSRFANVSGVLKTLELTGGIHFKIEGRKIIVTK